MHKPFATQALQAHNPAAKVSLRAISTLKPWVSPHAYTHIRTPPYDPPHIRTPPHPTTPPPYCESILGALLGLSLLKKLVGHLLVYERSVFAPAGRQAAAHHTHSGTEQLVSCLLGSCQAPRQLGEGGCAGAQTSVVVGCWRAL
jgi:hypothetical protein